VQPVPWVPPPPPHHNQPGRPYSSGVLLFQPCGTW